MKQPTDKKYRKTKVCPVCKGSCFCEEQPPTPCGYCEGKGKIPLEVK